MERIKIEELSRDVEINKEATRRVFGGVYYKPSYEDRNPPGYTGYDADGWDVERILRRKLGCGSLADAV